MAAVGGTLKGGGSSGGEMFMALVPSGARNVEAECAAIILPAGRKYRRQH